MLHAIFDVRNGCAPEKFSGNFKVPDIFFRQGGTELNLFFSQQASLDGYASTVKIPRSLIACSWQTVLGPVERDSSGP